MGRGETPEWPERSDGGPASKGRFESYSEGMMKNDGA